MDFKIVSNNILIITDVLSFSGTFDYFGMLYREQLGDDDEFKTSSPWML